VKARGLRQPLITHKSRERSLPRRATPNQNGKRPSYNVWFRNSAVTQFVKERYNYTCQFCGVRLEVDAGAYAEGAHIRLLGGNMVATITPAMSYAFVRMTTSSSIKGACTWIPSTESLRKLRV
jgi:hypothetical protein